MPFDTLVALDAPPLTAAQLKDASGQPRYQAVVTKADVDPALQWQQSR